jgi:outer membrane protein assembly factor BamB
MRARLLLIGLAVSAGIAVLSAFPGAQQQMSLPGIVRTDWPEWRGPTRDGASPERNLPEKWSPTGENVAWVLPFGGRSTPVIFGNRLYLQTTTVGDIEHTQERLVAVDVDSGKVVWEKRVSIYMSDVPQHRAGWASPAVDPETGNIYMFTVGAELLAFTPDGRQIWERSLPEEYGAITTHGGRTTSPIIEGGKVILNTLIQNWGSDLGRPGNRYFAFNKLTGQTIWVSSPQSKHYDTNYSTPIVADVNGQRLLMVGGTDGVFYGLQVNTGKSAWSVEVSKRAILNSVLFRNNIVYLSHGEENIDTTEMGMVAALDATGSGVLSGSALKWVTRGFLPTFASPVMDGERLYSVDNSAILGAFDLNDGKIVWTKTLGTLQKGSPVLADGKLYIGTENGHFYILRPSATGVTVLDDDLLGVADNPEPVLASPAIADGRIYVTTFAPVEEQKGSFGHLYAIGTRRVPTRRPLGFLEFKPADPGAPVAEVQVFPNEVMLDPGAKQTFKVTLFDAKGQYISDFTSANPAPAVQWSVDQLQGTVGADGTFTASASGGSAGFVKATVNGVTGQARVRVIPPLPWTYTFDADKSPMPWWTANLKTTIGAVNGDGVLVRPRDDTVGRRARIIMGKPDWSGYTIEADVRGVEMRRQRGDIGLINQRYVMVLFGNSQKIELHPWQAADEMTVRVPFEWNVDTWYRMKLRVDNQPNGTTLVRGKVWPTGQPEPAAWTIQKTDTIPHLVGAPGLYGDGISDVQWNNLRVYKNQ